MKISDCIIQLARAKEIYGDIDVVVLDQDSLRTPSFLHSHKDYYDVKESDVNMFISGSTWEDLGLQNPVLIIDHEYDNMLNYQDNNMET